MKLPVTAVLGVNMFFTGIIYAATLPYASLVGVETLEMAPGWFATVMAIGSVLGTAVSVVLGYFSDKLPDRRVLVLATALGGIIAHGMIYFWPTQAGFAISMAIVMPIGAACFSQCFAYIRVYYAKHAPERSDFMVTAMRTIFTLAWLIVPPAAGWVAAQFDIFYIYLASAMSYVIVGLIFAFLMSDPTTAVQMPAPPRSAGGSLLSALKLPPHTLLGLLGLVVMTTALRILTYTTPLFIVGDLGGDLTDIGFYAAITAAVEAPFMLIWGFLTTRLTKETLLASAGLIVAIFLALGSMVSDLSVFYWLLILNGIGTAALMSINISYVQDAIVGRVGLSTSLLDVVVIVSNLTGATAFGVLTTGGDYRFALGAGAGVAVLGATIMIFGNFSRIGRRSRVEQPT